MIKLILADDQPIYLDGLKTILAGVPGITITGEALNGKKALDLLEKEPADVVLLDINMPVMDGLQTAEAIKHTYKNVKIIMLTQYDDKKFMKKCKEMGVEGYLLKDCGKSELLNAIRNIYNGGTQYIAGNGDNNSFPVPDILNKLQITGQEHEGLKLMASEYCNADIARKLNIEINTVKTYKDRLKMKAGVKTTIGLIKWAIENGLI